MTIQPPALGSSRKVTVLGWSAVVVAAILLVALIIAVVRVNGASGDENALGPAATSSATPRSSSGAAPTAAPSSADDPAATPASTADAEAPVVESPAVPGDASAPVEKAPVALTDSAAAVPQVVFSLGALESVDGEAQGPGEIAGPALRFTLTVRNDTTASVSLASTVVNLYAGADQVPSMDLAEPGGVPLPDTVRAGQSATGTFVFFVPRDSRDPVKITVDYSVGIPVVVFEGPAPD